MYYVLSVSDSYPDSYWFEYDHENSLDYLEFRSGHLVNTEHKHPVFRTKRKLNIKKLQSFDLLMSDGGDFISCKFANLLRENCPSDVQLIKVDVFSNDETVGDFFISNIINIIPCADMHKSSYKPLMKSDPNGPIKFSKLEFIPNSLQDHMIVRCKEDPETVVVSEKFVKLCQDNKIEGITFLPNGVRS
jgi:hypothetical protein